ncbi:ESX-1 secretion-associated protein EspB-like [Hemicordylus capensis]|uniref:ESX-1 secretion-associated protein EspB-like n=1 Tax=Hemicordylus capensis TaxID=884348 RepID=UPI002302B167|nr:ESX-1 secretion-associated protein EspB-like [Hemicordylus capensis]
MKHQPGSPGPPSGFPALSLAMAAQRASWPALLACSLLVGSFLAGQASPPGSPCEQQVRARKPSLDSLQGQGVWVPLMIVLGGCCGLAWCVLFISYDVSQTGGRQELPQIPGKEAGEAALDCCCPEEEPSQAGSEAKSQGAGAAPAGREGLGGGGPSLPGEPTASPAPEKPEDDCLWGQLEKELERLLLLLRQHRGSSQPGAPGAKEALGSPAAPPEAALPKEASQSPSSEEAAVPCSERRGGGGTRGKKRKSSSSSSSSQRRRRRRGAKK